MVTVEKIAGSRYRSPATGEVTIGDRVDVDEAVAAYLCDERGDFQCVDGGTVDDAEHSSEDETTVPFDPSEYTISELEQRLESDDAETWDEDAVTALLQAERDSKDRAGAKELLTDVLER